MIRLLPFRQVNESDVINLFALETQYATENITGVGSGDAGVFVKVSTGNFNAEPVGYATESYLGKTDYPHVGWAKYPVVNKTVVPAGAGEIPLGVTLNQTAKYDENGEKLLYYPQKAKEFQVVLPGQAVPIATRGIFVLSKNAFDGPVSSYTIGGGIKISSGGKVTGASLSTALYLTGNTGETVQTIGGADAPTFGVFGTVLGTGSRTTHGNGVDVFSGEYLVVKIG